MRQVFVLGSFDDGLVAMPFTEATRLAMLSDALETSVDWGEFLGAVSNDTDTQAYVREHYGSELPDADEPFDPDELPGFAEGEWPAWPKAAMLDSLPHSVQALGTVRSVTFGPEFLHIDEGREQEVVEALAAEGLECRLDNDDLISRACGAWRYV